MIAIAIAGCDDAADGDDSGVAPVDAGAQHDSGAAPVDAGAQHDSGAPVDSGAQHDAGAQDAGVDDDAGVQDSGAAHDAGGCPVSPMRPAGEYELALHNVRRRCNRSDLSCVTELDENGAGTLTLTRFECASAPDTYRFEARLEAPTLALDPSGAHSEDFPALVADVTGCWDPVGKTTIRLEDYSCIAGVEGSEPGEIVIDIDLASGDVTIDRRCETELSTLLYTTRTTGTGTLVCE